jgi:arsenate reductase
MTLFRFLAIISLLSPSGSLHAAEQSLVPKLQNYVEQVLKQDAIPPSRQRNLVDIATVLAERLKADKKVSLLFVCTHNSRRSQMCQLWAAAAAHYYGISGIKTHSGGTESSAFNPRAVAAMRRAGFLIKTKQVGQNPHYEVLFADRTDALTAFSKVYSHQANPRAGFVAIMVCGDADEKCPVVSGSFARFSLHFIDPKVSDGTASETETYDKCCNQIAQELFFVMQQTKALIDSAN